MEIYVFFFVCSAVHLCTSSFSQPATSYQHFWGRIDFKFKVGSGLLLVFAQLPGPSPPACLSQTSLGSSFKGKLRENWGMMSDNGDSVVT